MHADATLWGLGPGAPGPPRGPLAGEMWGERPRVAGKYRSGGPPGGRPPHPPTLPSQAATSEKHTRGLHAAGGRVGWAVGSLLTRAGRPGRAWGGLSRVLCPARWAGAPGTGQGRSQASWVFPEAPDPAHGPWMLRFSGGLNKKKGLKIKKKFF